MSINRGDMNDGMPEAASRLLARGAADDARADRRLVAAAADLRTHPNDRLRERELVALRHAFAASCAQVEGDLRQHAARLLVARGAPEPALALAEGEPVVHAALDAAGLLATADFLAPMLTRTQMSLLAEALPVMTAQPSDRPSLLVRLSTHRDGVVASAAAAALAADARRRAAIDGDAPRNDIAAEQQHRLVWWACAALRTVFAPAAAGERPLLDRALTEAAERALAVHDEGDRAEATAMRLVQLLAPPPAERPALLVEALADRRVPLFVALLAQALELPFDTVAALVLDPSADRLWLALRAAALDRVTIAQIGLALCEADPRREVETFADMLDAIMAITPDVARAAIGALWLHPDLKAALKALEGGR